MTESDLRSQISVKEDDITKIEEEARKKMLPQSKKLMMNMILKLLM